MTTSTQKITHLFRPFNLAVIAATMYLLRWSLLKPMLVMVSEMVELEIESQIPEFWFAILVLSVVLIAAGGYVLNDIKDVKVDSINHGKNPVGSLISESNANRIYQILTVLGLFLGFVVGYKLGNYNYGIIQLAAAISLWFYSNYFKTELIIGNLVVAFVVALVPLITGIYEVSLLQIKYFNKITTLVDFNFNFIAYWFIGYAAFAFLLTWVREILKDIEDIEGDQQVGARTLPIQFGVKPTLVLSSIIYGIVLYGLIYLKTYFLVDQISMVFIVITCALILFNIVVMWMQKSVLITPSNWSKIISLIGVFYLLALGYIIENQLFFNV